MTDCDAYFLCDVIPDTKEGGVKNVSTFETLTGMSVEVLNVITVLNVIKS